MVLGDEDSRSFFPAVLPSLHRSKDENLQTLYLSSSLLKGEKGKVSACSFPSKGYTRKLNVSHWLDFSQMAIPSCKGGWEM